MREILFRGKRANNGEWVYGFYIENELFDGRLEPSIIPVDAPDDCVVSWLKESAKWNLPGCDGHFCTASKNCEVIGNIHDNPELLER